MTRRIRNREKQVSQREEIKVKRVKINRITLARETRGLILQSDLFFPT